MADPIATAFVLVRPLLTGFAATLTTELNAAVAVAQASVKPIVIPVTTTGAAGGAPAAAKKAVADTTAATTGLTGAIKAQAPVLGVVTQESARLAAARASLAGAELREVAATERLVKAQATAGTTTAQLTKLERQQELAVLRLAAAQQRLALAQLPSKNLEQGLVSARNEANLLRGGLIGLARVTPVAVFGLGVAGTAAIGLGLGLKTAVQDAARFEQSLNVFQAVSGATADQMKEVSKAALELGADMTLPAVTAQNAADALTALSKAGLSIPDALAGVRGVLQLSTAASISAQDAAEIAASAINSFELSGDQIPHIADLLAGAANAAQGDITDFAAALSQASSVAFQSGLTIEQLTGVFTEAARAGLRGADMGTSVRTTLLRLIPTTKEATAFTEALGIHLDRNKTIGEQLPSIIDQYKTALDLLLPTQRTMVENQIVGQDSIRLFDILVRKGSKGLEEATDAANKEGEAARIAAAKTKGLTGSWNNLKNQAERTATAIGQKLSPALKIATDLMAGAIEQSHNLFTALGDLGKRDDDESGPLAFGPTKGETEEFIGKKLADAKHSFGRFWNDFTGSAKAAQKKALQDISDAGSFGLTFFPSEQNLPPGALFGGIDPIVTAAEKAARDRVDAVSKVTASLKQSMSATRKRLNDAIEVARAESDIGPLVDAEAALLARDIVELRRLERALRAGATNIKDSAARVKELKLEIANTLNDLFEDFTDPALNPTFANIEIQGINASATETLIDDIKNDQLAVAAASQALDLALLGGALGVSQKTIFEKRKDLASAQAKLASDQRAAAAAAKSAATAGASAAKSDADDAEKALDVQEENLRFFADLAENQGKAEQKLIAFLEKRLRDARGNQEKINKARADLANEQAKAAQSLRDSVQSALDLQSARLDTRLAAALQTATTDDEKRIYNAQIKLLNTKIANQLAIAKKAGFASKVGRTALVAIEGFKKEIIGIEGALKGLTSSGGGFSLNDLWESAAKQLSDFGSNISFGPMTPGENVQSVASNILAQKPDSLAGVVASKADKQISEAQTSNGYLREIRDFLAVPGVQGGTPWRRRNPLTDTPGTAADAAKFAVAGVGGM